VEIARATLSHRNPATVAYAIQLAVEQGATVKGLAVIDWDALCPLESVPLGAGEFKRERDAAVLDRAWREFAKLLADFERCCHDAQLRCRTQLLEGDAATVLCTEAQRVDLLVVGKQHQRAAWWEPASQTLPTVLHHSPRPVLCVPVSVPRRPTLIAYDGSACAAKALQMYANSGLSKERAWHLLTVGDDFAGVAQLGLDFLSARGINATTHLIPSERVVDRILETATHIDAGLIVMGAYGHSRVREFMFGSVTKGVLRSATMPVFLYH